MKLIKEWTHNGTCPGGWFTGNYQLGFESSTVVTGGRKYLGRKILYVLGYSVRLHTFYAGDDARAPHDHPWSFWTMPLCEGYLEETPNTDGEMKYAWVKGWRFHFRRSSHQHFIPDSLYMPFRTLVITGKKDRNWGFWPAITWDEALKVPGMIFWHGTKVFRKFVPWREWK